LCNKYYDYTNYCFIVPKTDGCKLNEWEALSETVPCTIHPKGFPIFLSPDKLATSDEYLDFDPYAVELNIESEFQKRRAECTIQLVTDASAEGQKHLKILDVGCGQGHITNKVRQSIPNAEISAIDCSLSAICYSIDHFQDIDFVVGDAFDLPYSVEYFDLIICNNLWEHVPDPLLLLSKMKSVLKNNGSIIVSTPSRYRLGNLLGIIRGKPIDFMSKNHVTEYTVGQITEQFNFSGFKIRKILSKPDKGLDLKHRILRYLFSVLIVLTRSKHQLDSTVFYWAQKVG
jgi:2-polyprenyl-3-methyl-5-hydroxy-6-metoxy-1,4-benzoquinol methylase